MLFAVSKSGNLPVLARFMSRPWASMKKGIICLALVLLARIATAAVFDAPHNDTNNIGCSRCHSYSVWWQYSPGQSNCALRAEAVPAKAHPGIAVHDVTYSTLTSLMAGGKLVVGDKYRVTDYRTRYTIPGTKDTHTGNVEALVLTANSDNRFDMLVVSEDHPEDIIYYTVSNKILCINDFELGKVADPAVDRGYILYRKDTIRNVEVGEDFRNMVYRRWETVAGNGVYAHSFPITDDAAYQDFPMFADYNVTSEVHIDHHRGNSGEETDGNLLSNVVFRSRAYKVEMLDGAESATFLGSVVELSMKFCSKGVFYGKIERVVLGTGSELTVTGDLYSVYVNKEEMLLDGNFSNVEILSSYTKDRIVGDYSNTVFGVKADTTETGTLSIRVMNDKEKRIGQAVICPAAREADGHGVCTVVQNDADRDGLDDITGNPISDGRSAVIKTSAADEKARIFLTPRTLIQTPLAVTEIMVGQSFKVEITNAVTVGTKIDWMIVEER